MFKLECCVMTDIGKVRKNNEDSFFLNGTYKKNLNNERHKRQNTLYGNGIIAVFDGMGGEYRGERAALTAAETLKEFSNPVDFTEFTKTANARICDIINANGGERSGSTFAILNISDSSAHCANIGDSRIYIFRKGRLIRLSQDHTKAAQMVRLGVIPNEEAASVRDRHILTQYLGIFPEEMVIEPYKTENFAVADKDIFLLCSDGLTDMLADDDIAAVLKKRRSAENHAEILLNTALERGGTDNITVAVVLIRGDSSIVKKVFGVFLK